MAHVIVTGHSRGLGAALTRLLLAKGHRVLGVSRGRLDATAMISGALEEVQLDLGASDAVERFLNSRHLHRFLQSATDAVLINNAGLLGPVGQTGQLPSLEIFQAVTANVASAIALTNAVLAESQHCRDRRVVHISSGAARSPYSGWTVYCATKAGLDHHARSVATENHTGLRVESLAPGIMDTDMQAQVRSTTVDQFPMRPKFEKLKHEGALASPISVAERLMTHLFSDRFGQDCCTDLRQF